MFQLRLLCLLLSFAVCATAQCKTDVLMSVATTGNNSGGLVPAIGASVRVCQLGATGLPCTPLETLYTDQSFGTVQPSNPFTTDSQGNFTFCAKNPTVYLESTYKGTVKVQATYVIASAANAGGGGGTPGGIQTINSNNNPNQLIVPGVGIVVVSSGGTTTISTSGTTPPPAALDTITLSPASVPGGTPSTGTAALTAVAPSGGALVTLTSSNTAVATLSVPSITIPAGSTTGTFTVNTVAVTANATSIITGNYGVAKTSTLTITAPSNILGGFGAAGAASVTSATATTATLNNGVALTQIKGTGEVSGDTWTLNPPGPAGAFIYLLLNGSNRTFTVDGLPLALATGTPTTVTFNGRTMYLYQSAFALIGPINVRMN